VLTIKTGYNLLLTASEMPEACRYLLVRLQMEKEKLIGWAILAGVSEEENTLTPSLKLNRLTVIDAMREMQVLLLDVNKIYKRYKLRLVADEADADATPHEVSQQALPDRLVRLEERAIGLFDKTRKFPKKLKWTVFHKDKFEEMLSNIVTLNESMMRFLESHDREKHFKMQEITLMQILQVNNRIGDLFQLVESLRDTGAMREKRRVAVGLSASSEETSSEEYEERAVRLTRFKAVRLAIEAEQTGELPGNKAVAQAAELSIEKMKLVSTADDVERGRKQRSCGAFDSRPVWVEWKYYEPALGEGDDSDGNDPQPPSFVENRISKMAKLLRDQEKPPEFRVPDCLGYVRDLKQCRLGFVFTLDATSAPSLPISLFELISSRPKPSLTTRIKIASLISSSIWYLHSTQWLHKGLRSENIVFQSLKAFSTPLPLLCGFDYSRPVNVNQTTTEQPLENPLHDLYRHPGTQFYSPRDGRHGFRRLYDIYSLGVILAEIGLWRPVHAILHFDLSQRIKTAMVKGAREELLRHDRLETLVSEAGAVFASVVKACLSSDFASTEASVAEGNPSLQLDFWEKVVKPLQGIVV
jgi:Prion-inhibition and propagation